MSAVLSRGLRASFGLADQALVAAAGLALHVVLGRYLSPAEYGAFAVTHAVLLFALGAHTAVVTEPMTVLGPGRHSHELAGFIRSLGPWHHLLVAAATVAAAVAGAVLWGLDRRLAIACVGLALALPAFLLFHLVRRIAYTRLRTARAFTLSLGFLLLLAALLTGLVSTGHLSSLSAWVALAVATGVPALAGLAASAAPPRVPDWQASAAEAWTYGRWMLLANLAHWLGAGLFVPAAGVMLGLDEAGTFRALQNLVAPVQQLLAAVSLLALPVLARRAGDPAGLRRGLAGLALWTIPPSLIYALLLVVFGPTWVDLLYAKGAYSQASGLLSLFALAVILTPVVQSLSLSLRAAERPGPIFRGKVVAALTTLCVGLPLMARLGVTGAVVGFVLSLAAEAAVLAFAFPWRTGT